MKKLIKKLWIHWHTFRHWWNHRGHAEVGDTIFFAGSCYQVLSQQHTHTFGPPELQVIKTIPLPEGEESYLFKSEYQKMRTPHPPTTLTGINRFLYVIYHCLFADQLNHTTPHLHFSRTTLALWHATPLLHEAFAPLPYQHRIIYWRPIGGRWFLHTGLASQIKLDMWSDDHQEAHDCRIVLQDGTCVAREHVIGALADAALSRYDAGLIECPF